jgi:hypothetical protein
MLCCFSHEGALASGEFRPCHLRGRCPVLREWAGAFIPVVKPGQDSLCANVELLDHTRSQEPGLAIVKYAALCYWTIYPFRIQSLFPGFLVIDRRQKSTTVENDEDTEVYRK